MTPTVSIGGHGRDLVLANPVIAGAGTIGYGREGARILPLERLGAIVTNTTTLRPRRGAPQPRLAETPAGILLAGGFQNPGLRTVLQRHSAFWQRLAIPVILSIAGEDIAALRECVELADAADGVAAIQLEPDLLPPDVDVVQVVDSLRNLTTLPLLVHLPIASWQATAEMAIDVAAVGADAVVVGSPWPGLAMDRTTGRPALVGSVAGPAIRPLALRLVYEVVRLMGPEGPPVIAVGGICSPEDVADFLAAGACAVQLDTVVYSDPAAVIAMVERDN